MCVYEPSTRPGPPLPHAFVLRHGERLPLQDLTHGGRFLLITDENGAPWLDAAHKVTQNLGVPLVAVTVGTDTTDPIDQRFASLRKREITSHGAVLVRPDRFVAFRSMGADDDPVSRLSEAFAQILAR